MVEDDDGEARVEPGRMEDAGNGQPLFLRTERARIPPADEREGVGDADRLVLEDRDAAGAETGQVPLEATVELVAIS